MNKELNNQIEKDDKFIDALANNDPIDIKNPDAYVIEIATDLDRELSSEEKENAKWQWNEVHKEDE